MADQGVVFSKRLVAINSASSLVAKLINMTVLLWMYQYLLTRISAEEFAILPLVTSLMIFAPVFFSFFTGGISRFVMEAYATGDLTKVTGIVSSIFPLLAATGVLFVGLGMSFAVHLDAVLNIPAQSLRDAQIMLMLLVTNFAIQMLALPFRSGFHVHQRFVELNMLGVARDMVRIILLFILLLGIGPSVVWVVVATVTSETLYAFVTVLRARAILPQLRVKFSMFDWTQARQLTGFGLWTTVGQLGMMMYTSSATILLNIFGTPVDVTVYYIGSTFFRQIDSTVQLAAQPLQPTLTAMHALHDRARLARSVLRGGRIALWVTLFVATPLAFFADSFIDLYLDGDYPQAAWVTVIFLMIFPFTSPTALLAMTAIATAQVRAFFLPAFLFQLLGMVLMLLILSQTDAGAIGVTVALTAITIASQLLYYWPLCTRLVDISAGDFVSRLLRPGLTPAVAASVMALLLREVAYPGSWLALIAVGVLCAGTYVMALIFLALDAGERRELDAMLVRVLPSRRSKHLS